jgi:hypothetical protein
LLPFDPWAHGPGKAAMNKSKNSNEFDRFT